MAITPVYGYKLATSYGALINLELMTVPVFPPKHSLLKYSKPIQIGTGGVRGLGWLVTYWHWDYLTQAQYTALKTICPGLSANVYITMPNNAGTLTTYTAIMVWPADEPEYEAGLLLDVTIEFRGLTVYSP